MTDLTTEEAIAWFACMQSDRRTRTDEDRFAQWLKQDARHAEAYARVEKVWRAAGPPIVPRAAKGAAPGQGPERRLTAGRLSIAASLGMFAVALTLFYLHGRPISEGSFVTPTGYQRALELSDGSTVTLNTRSEVKVDFDAHRRVVRLVNGEVRFRVARDAKRPFIVESGAAQVRALGTEFDVRMAGPTVSVTLLEGSVEVASSIPAAPARPAVILEPGQQLAIDFEKGQERINYISLEQANAWLRLQLIFDAVPLAQAVEEANRYLATPIVVGEASLADMRVSGVVRAGSPESFVGALESAFPIRAVEGRSGTVLLPKDD